MNLSRFAPARRRGVELLDEPATPADVRQRAMADLARSNRYFGGVRAAVRPVLEVLRGGDHHATLLDVGTGTGDIAQQIALAAQRRGVRLFAIGCDVSRDMAVAARAGLAASVVADAMRLPFRDHSVDVVTCSQVLHHFVDNDARRVISEMHRVARGSVVISDLSRSRLAAAGFWLASTVLRFHPVTRRDGVVSVYRGFTASELGALVRDAVGVEPRVRRGIFWRLSASWSVTGSESVSTADPN